ASGPRQRAKVNVFGGLDRLPSALGSVEGRFVLREVRRGDRLSVQIRSPAPAGGDGGVAAEQRQRFAMRRGGGCGRRLIRRVGGGSRVDGVSPVSGSAGRLGAGRVRRS